MSKSKWLPTMEVIGVVAAAALFAVTFGRLAVQGQLPGGHRSDQEQRYSGANVGNAQVWAPSPYDRGEKSNAYTASCESPRDREEADLCQQWRSAEAAEKTAVVAGTQIYWNVVQLVGVIFTAIAAWAAAVAARAANASVSVAQDNAIRELRAYLVIKEGVIEVLDHDVAHKKLRAHVKMLNSGQTPAYSFSSWVKCTVRPDTESTPFSDVLSIDDRTSDSIVGPNCLVEITVDYIIPQTQLREILDGRSIIYVWGGCDFETLGLIDRCFIFRSINGRPFMSELNRRAWPIQPHKEGYHAN